MSRFNPHKPVKQLCRKHHFYLPEWFSESWDSKEKKEYRILSWKCVTCDSERQEKIDVTDWTRDEIKAWEDQAEASGFTDSTIPF